MNGLSILIIKARGKLTCNGKPAAGVKVKLYDSDNSILPGVTDSNGEYNLSGSTKELSGIEPYIAIYHDCEDGIKYTFIRCKHRTIVPDLRYIAVTTRTLPPFAASRLFTGYIIVASLMDFF
uniref:Transthyretin-like family protein n=1 Tax=Heterorhabditis bacteriophora TaxID=37862 RepID=A0A1I7X077_HETBA